jgi:AcrR family transcriptional regulator
MDPVAPGDNQRGYHHGDLRAALLKAATAELAEHGVEGFTLRSCARRAGVSHAAPAHHFGDVTGLLTEVAIDAFGRLAASMRHQIAKADRGSIEHPVAAALGYVLFATASPAEFKLMFLNAKLDARRPELRQAASVAFGLAAESAGEFYGVAEPMAEPVAARRVIALWSLAHGVASLLIAEQLSPPGMAARTAAALVPDMVRELFGELARDEPRDLKFIARMSAARRG